MYKKNCLYCGVEIIVRNKKHFLCNNKECKQRLKRELWRKYYANNRELRQEYTKIKWHENKEAKILYDKLRAEKQKARARAKYKLRNKKRICNKCKSEKNVQLHHIDKDVTNNNLTNLIYLCSVCHGLEHRKKYA